MNFRQLAPGLKILYRYHPGIRIYCFDRFLLSGVWVYFWLLNCPPLWKREMRLFLNDIGSSRRTECRKIFYHHNGKDHWFFFFREGPPFLEAVYPICHFLGISEDTVSLFRPLALLLFKISFPSAEDILLRNPCLLRRLRLLGWYVLFIYCPCFGVDRFFSIFQSGEKYTLNSLKCKNFLFQKSLLRHE